MLTVAGWLDSTAANGTFVYALDDAYIHLTIGRTLAEHGVWGVSPREFSSASSSPLWTILLALWCRLFGASDLAPLALNAFFACLLIVVSDSRLCRSWPGYAERPWHRFAFLCMLMFAIPMPTLILSGMEHLLHALLAVLFVLKAVGFLWSSNDHAEPTRTRREVGRRRPDGAVQPDPTRTMWEVGRRRPDGAVQPDPTEGFLALSAIAALTVATRYESMALVAPVLLILAWRRKWNHAIPLALASLLPVVLFGMYSLVNGMPFVPASILVKTVGLTQGVPAWFLFTPLVKAAFQIFVCPPLLIMTALGILAVIRVRREPDVMPLRAAGASGVFAAAAIIHADFAGVGWFYRYEAYLVAIGMVTVLPAFVADIWFHAKATGELKRTHASILFALVLLLSWPFFVRAARSLADTPLAYRNVGDQQMQLARFLAAKGTGKTIALNDIGAVGYYSDTPMFDLFGLASPEIYHVRIRREYSTETIDRLARQAGAETAILTPDWYRPFGGIPASWTQVATWKIENNIICGSDTVAFYAITSNARDDLERRLKEFGPSLPPDVTVAFTGDPARK